MFHLNLFFRLISGHTDRLLKTQENRMDDYRSLRIRYVVFIAAALLGAIFLIEYATRGSYQSKGQPPITDSLITDTYPRLYEAVFQRSADEIKPYLKHKNQVVRHQAWRALAHTPIDSLELYVQRARQSGSEEAWFALSLHPFSGELLRTVEQVWLREPNQRGGINRLLGEQGDEQTLQFLLDNQETVSGSTHEYEYSLAVGRLMTKYKLDPGEQLDVIRRAFEVTDADISRGYLYGFYRGSTQELNRAVRDSLYQQWKLYGLGNDTTVDQYIAKILKGLVLYEITMYYNSENLLDTEVQLGVELARVLSEAEFTQDHALAAKILVTHPNPQVAQQALAGIEDKISSADHLFSFIKQDMLNSAQTTDIVWLQALETAAMVEPDLVSEHKKRLDQIRTGNPYLLPRILSLWQIIEPPTEVLDFVESIVREKDRLSTMYVLQFLAGYWTELTEEEKSDQLKEQVREIVFEALALKDRGVAYMGWELLEQEDLFGVQDFDRINNLLASFRLPEDIEVYQAFGSLYKDRFEKQAKPVIDSLAALEYLPLNRSLNQMGWDVTVPEDAIQQEFRTPDWNRIWELGRHPIWVLTTGKGDIKVQMDVLSAPATVSAIDSLTQAGAYDGVPFHRVVPNFVIQGGDVERRDGFGGPDFVIPTEASEEEFDRGAAGIASAGPDTEGSQYFFMHQWSPHLNGRYTLFGQVIDGMDVVDRIVVGDKVEKAYWE